THRVACGALHSFPTRRSSDLVMRSTMELGKGTWVSIHCASSASIAPAKDKNIRCAISPLPWILSQDITVKGTVPAARRAIRPARSEEHTSELQSRFDLVCRLL